MQKYKDIPPIKAEIDYLDENVLVIGLVQRWTGKWFPLESNLSVMMV